MNRRAALLVAFAAALVAAGPPPRPAYLPDPALTPGRTVPATQDDVCTPGFATRSRDVPQSRKVAVYKRYGIAPDSKSYEIDHLIPLTCAGANDITNLFPMPYLGSYGAKAKDRLESRMNREVCAGRVTLSEAQAAFRTDWTVAYRKYFSMPYMDPAPLPPPAPLAVPPAIQFVPPLVITPTAAGPAPVAPPAPTVYQFADRFGQVWTHTDPAYLTQYVAGRNATPRPVYAPAYRDFTVPSCASGRCPR